jgi:hypothetical protein
MSDKMVEEMARALAIADGKDPDAPAWIRYPDGQPEGLCWRDQYLKKAQAAATIAERRMEEMRAERDKWKQRAFELECEHGDLKGVFVESRAALRPSGGV